MLVALTISEEAMYPLIQSFVWAKIGAEPRLLKRVLDGFIRVKTTLNISDVYERKIFFLFFSDILFLFMEQKVTVLMCVCAKISLQMGISDGLGSRKLEVLADTAVTLEQGTSGAVVTEVVKKMLKVKH